MQATFFSFFRFSKAFSPLHSHALNTLTKIWKTTHETLDYLSKHKRTQ